MTPALFSSPGHGARVPAEVNQLNNQVLVRTFEREWVTSSADETAQVSWRARSMGAVAR